MTFDQDNEWYDVIIFKTPDLGTGLAQQLQRAQTIVHECTHAGIDLLQFQNMTHSEHEADAYIAAAIFMVAKMLSVGGRPRMVRFTEPIETAAWEIALQVVETGSPNSDTLVELYKGIFAHPQYKKTVGNLINNDGVGREWKIRPRGG